MDMQLYAENRPNFPEEELARYAGRYVAWSPDGTRIIASADDLGALCDAVDASDFDPEEVVMGRVPLRDELVLGGGANN